MANENKIDEATSLALTRTRLAADRTLMSWIRTSFSMISFGFAIIKFFELLMELRPADARVEQMASSTKMGVFLILLGIFSLIPASLEYTKELKYISSVSGKKRRWSYVLVVAILVGIIGVYALADSMAKHFFY